MSTTARLNCQRCCRLGADGLAHPDILRPLGDGDEQDVMTPMPRSWGDEDYGVSTSHSRRDPVVEVRASPARRCRRVLRPIAPAAAAAVFRHIATAARTSSREAGLRLRRRSPRGVDFAPVLVVEVSGMRAGCRGLAEEFPRVLTRHDRKGFRLLDPCRALLIGKARAPVRREDADVVALGMSGRIDRRAHVLLVGELVCVVREEDGWSV